MQLSQRFIPVLLAAGGLATAYIVEKGDTLWDLSGRFLANPFRWTDLWEANKESINDPHWIYPGDSLKIPGDKPVVSAAKSLPDTGWIAGSGKPEDIPDSLLPKGVQVASWGEGLDRDAEFLRNLGGLKTKDSSVSKVIKAKDEFHYRKPEPPRMFNRYYQQLAPRILGMEEYRGAHFPEISWGEKVPSAYAQIGDEIILKVGRSSTALKSGDAVDIVLPSKIQVKQQDTAKPEEKVLLRLVGVARVKNVGDKATRCILERAFNPVDPAKVRVQISARAEPILVTGYQELPGAKSGEMRRLIATTEIAQIVTPASYVIVSGGKGTGWAPGDAVAFWEDASVDSGLPPRLLGRGVVVTIGEENSVVLVRELYSSTRRLEVGNLVSITHKAVGPQS